MRPNGTFKLSSLDDPTGTIFVADIDGYNSCLYPDENDNGGKINSGNVLYRHSGGTEKSSFYMHEKCLQIPDRPRISPGYGRGSIRGI